MKKARLLLAILALSMTAGACSSSLTAPECDPKVEECGIVPGSNN